MDIRKETAQVLCQVEELLGLISKEQYTESIAVLSNNSIGKHIRHIVEFHQCLLSGIVRKEIHYDKRERNLLLETDIYYAQKTIREIREATTLLNDCPITLNMSYTAGNYTVNTSIFRELAYNIEHTIHHLAIIKIGIITHFPKIALPEAIGVAHSTLQNQEKPLAVN